MQDEDPNLIIGWDELTSAALIDLCEAVRTWVKQGESQRVRLCDEYINCKSCPAGIVHPQRVKWRGEHNSLCSAMDDDLLTPEELLMIVEHEMDKRGMLHLIPF